MKPEIITVTVFIATFSVTLLAVLLFLDARSRRKNGLVVHRSFGRLAAPSGSANIDMAKTTEYTPEQTSDKNRLRIYLFGIFAGGVFGTLLTKLWSLQLLSQDYYLGLAQSNQTTEVTIPAIRGRLLDRKGREMVGNRASLIVTAPKTVVDDRNLVHRLSLVLGIPKPALRARLSDDRLAAAADRVLASDISMRAAAYIQTHPHLFAGVAVQSRATRHYPYGSLAAHLLGYIGPVTQEELDDADPDSALEPEDFIGKTGAEYVYEQYLAGTKGKLVYQRDVHGNPTALLGEVAQKNGADVCLTIDLDIQRATDRILPQIIASAKRDLGKENCNAGALVVMDVSDGGILAMTSLPTFFPEAFTQGISQELWNQMMQPGANNPLLNRVTSGRYPAASTFKAFTSLAGFHHGLIDDHTQCYCRGYWDRYGSKWIQRCWTYPYGYGHGTLDFEEAINQSCDVFFYDLAAGFYSRWELMSGDKPERINELQEYLRGWGFGSKTGLDGLAESAGRVPDAAWKREAFADVPEDYDWVPGDMTNMIIGQGDLLVTPLQICNGYAGIARRRMLKPHTFHRIINERGETISSYQIRESDIQPQFDEANVRRLEEGFARVVARNGGNFRQLPVSVLAKTGTGEMPAPKETCSWFVAYAPADDPKYCVACLVEEAGTGDSVAMPAVQHTLAAIYGVDLGPIRAGKGTGER
jgi:penicillin-binding protein 2